MGAVIGIRRMLLTDDTADLIARPMALLKGMMAVLIGIMLGLVVFYLIYSAFDRLRIGQNAATDNECLNRTVQWCK